MSKVGRFILAKKIHQSSCVVRRDWYSDCGQYPRDRLCACYVLTGHDEMMPYALLQPCKLERDRFAFNVVLSPHDEYGGGNKRHSATNLFNALGCQLPTSGNRCLIGDRGVRENLANRRAFKSGDLPLLINLIAKVFSIADQRFSRDSLDAEFFEPRQDLVSSTL